MVSPEKQPLEPIDQYQQRLGKKQPKKYLHAVADGVDYREPYRVDYCRLVHSSAFRRLQGKTQLFPGTDNDFFRNRLTHSIEVAQIAKDLAVQINCLLREDRLPPFVSPEVCEVAGLAHDLGHPPFGHIGEKALDECMLPYGGFEGNAQTLRIVLRLEKKVADSSESIEKGVDNRRGLDLTSRVLGSILKYDEMIPMDRTTAEDKSLKKGYYECDATEVAAFKSNLSSGATLSTIECQIMDFADDVAYSSHDLEDALKAGYIEPFELLVPSPSIMTRMVERLARLKNWSGVTVTEVSGILLDLFNSVFLDSSDVKLSKEEKKVIDQHYHDSGHGPNYPALADDFRTHYLFKHATSLKFATSGFERGLLISSLIHRFLVRCKIGYNPEHPLESTLLVPPEIRKEVDVLKTFSYVSFVDSDRLRVNEHRGREIVTKIFRTLCDGDNYKMLPRDFLDIYQAFDGDQCAQRRTICDFVASMTDKFAVDFHSKLFVPSI